MIHRDVKPSNIIVSEREGRLYPKVLDLGSPKSRFPKIVPTEC